MTDDTNYSSIVCYLTAEGWKSDLKDVRPDDHLETWEHNIKRSYEFAHDSLTWRLLWRNPAFAVEKLAIAHSRFPKPTRQVSW